MDEFVGKVRKLWTFLLLGFNPIFLLPELLKLFKKKFVVIKFLLVISL
jgi:hypothetical protein